MAGSPEWLEPRTEKPVRLQQKSLLLIFVLPAEQLLLQDLHNATHSTCIHGDSPIIWNWLSVTIPNSGGMAMSGPALSRGWPVVGAVERAGPSLYKLLGQCPLLQFTGRHLGRAAQHRGSTLIRTHYLYKVKIQSRCTQYRLYKSSYLETYILWEVSLEVHTSRNQEHLFLKLNKAGHGHLTRDQEACDITACFVNLIKYCLILLLLVYLLIKLEIWPLIALKVFRPTSK